MAKSSCGVCHSAHTIGPFIGRFLLSLIFIIAGISKALTFEASVAVLEQLNVPHAGIYMVIGILFELVGGVLVLLGWFTRIGAWLLMVFLLPTTLIVHGFWNYTGEEQFLQTTLFLKNLTIYGGLTLLVSYGPGKWSFDACRSCAKTEP